MLSQFLCFIGCHDWRNMDGYCCECGEEDGLWMRDMHPTLNVAAPTGVEPVSSDSKSGASPLGHGAMILLTIAAILYYLIFAFLE